MVDMNFFTNSTLNGVLVKCLMQYPNQMRLSFGFFDSKRAEIEQYDIILRKNELAESFIPEQFLIAVDTYVTLILAAIGICINILAFRQIKPKASV